MQTILIVEDDHELNRGIAQRLRREGYDTCGAYSLGEAKRLLAKEEPALILLDVSLPDGEGFDLMAWMRDSGKRPAPVIFLTARDLEADALKGYELGAADYVTKPFSANILARKIAIALNRSDGQAETDFCDGNLTIQLRQGRVGVRGEACGVTPTEFRILSAFFTYRNQLLTYDMLLQYLWDGGSQFVDRHALAVNINRLRGKLEDDGHKYIANVYGMGYQWIG